MEKPEIIGQNMAVWCAANANAAFAAGGAVTNGLGPAGAAFICNVAAAGVVWLGGGAL